MTTNHSVGQVAAKKQTESKMNDRVLSRSFFDSTRFQFWYWGVLRLGLGVAQIVMVLWCLALFFRDGLNAGTMHVAFTGVALTTLSLLLFKIPTKGQVKRPHQ